MPAFAKIKAGRVNTLDFSQFVGEEGHLFYNVITGELRISDGHTVGGNPIAITATTINTASIIPEIDDVYGIGDPNHRWNHIHVGSGGIYMNGGIGTEGYTLRVDPVDDTLTYRAGTGNLAVGSVTFPDNSRQTQAFEPTALPHPLLPKDDVITDLGSPTKRFGNIYLGPSSLWMADSITDANIEIKVVNGTLYLNGAQNLAIGNLVIMDTTLQSLTSDLDISIGDNGDTGIFRIKRKTAVTTTTFSDTESAFIINANGQEPSTLFPDTLLTTVARPNKNSRIVQRAYGADPVTPAINAYPVWASYVARGNVAVPTPTQSGDILMRLSANGRGTTGWGAGGARVEVVALETFTDIAKGTQINFWTTPVGSSTTVNSASVRSSGFTGNAFTFTTDGSTQSTAGIPMTYRGNLQANKVATLGIDGRLDTSQIPTSLTGAIVFQGGWDAANNSPTLSNSTGTTGYQYIVTVGGAANLGIQSETYVSGDTITYGGNVWNRTTGSSPFTSLSGGGHITVDNPTGAMTLGSDATPNYTSGTIVSRDSNGNFVANVITATLTGTASTAITAGTVTNPEQTTITKLGTLGNLTVSGNVSATYYTGSALYLTGVAKSSDIAGANAAISSLTGSISGANAAISTLTNNLAGANAAIATINGNVAGANAAISTLTNNLSGANAAIATINGNVAGANAAIGTLTNNLAGANAAIATINSNVAGANAAISSLTGSISGANAAIGTLTNNLAGANAAIATLQTQVYANANVATYLPSYSGNIQASYLTVTNTTTLANTIVNGNIAVDASHKITTPKIIFNDGGVRTIAGGTPTVTLDFSSDSIISVWQPAGTVTLQYGTLVAGSSITVLINLATKRAILLGVTGTNNSSAASTSLSNGAGTPGLVNNQLVSLVYTCADGTAANTYVSCSYA